MYCQAAAAEVAPPKKALMKSSMLDAELTTKASASKKQRNRTSVLWVFRIV
jgi:hypothetical protein